MKRYKHSLSHYKLATFDLGKLIPVGCVEVLQGDSFRQATSALIRLAPLATPVMHPCTVRIHHWFVPFRLVWDGFEDFITGGNDGEGGSSGAFPVITAGGGGFANGSLLDYMGVKPGVAGISVSALPVRAYNLIYNNFYRDQDLVSAVNADSEVVQRIAWEKDRFTAARPWTQRGPDVLLPLGTSAPVEMVPGYPKSQNLVRNSNTGVLSGAGDLVTDSGSGLDIGGTGMVIDPNGAWQADLSNASAVSVLDVREAFALQRMMEARALYGARFTEWLRYYGIRSSDARLQLPEYLGGGKQTIAFSEVLQTAPDATTGTTGADGVGNLRGHGISAMRSNRYIRFFEEPGVVLTLMSIRPRTLYGDGTDAFWWKTVKEQFWQKELEDIGQQEVLRREVYTENATNNFGYGPRYDEYRSHPSTIAAEFRTVFNDWHFARLFGGAPALNQSFTDCDPGVRPFQVSTNHKVWAMVNNSIQTRRLVCRPRTGRIY